MHTHTHICKPHTHIHTHTHTQYIYIYIYIYICTPEQSFPSSVRSPPHEWKWSHSQLVPKYSSVTFFCIIYVHTYTYRYMCVLPYIIYLCSNLVCTCPCHNYMVTSLYDSKLLKSSDFSSMHHTPHSGL